MNNLNGQKHIISKGLALSIDLNTKYHLISVDWFNKWKSYVNFNSQEEDNRTKEVIVNLYPGPVDNSNLKEIGSSKLKKGLIEGNDYIILPKPTGDILFRIYNGGPQFIRNPVNIGSSSHPLIQLDLYPIQLHVYHVDNIFRSINPQYSNRYKILEYKKNLKLNKAFARIIDDFKINLASGIACRFWIKTDLESVKNLNLDSERNGQMESKETDTYVNKRPRNRRFLTEDITDYNGEWKFLREVPDVSLIDLLEEKDHLEFVIESTDQRNPKLMDWPWADKLEKWKKDLKAGDIVDACNKEGNWYEALILDFAIDKIKVHFRSMNYDEIINPSSIHERIMPYNSVTFDRYLWEEENKIEVNVAGSDKKPVWISAIIHKVDNLNEQVEIKISNEKKKMAIKNSTALLLNSDLNDNTNTQDEDDQIDSDEYKWYDLFDEDICCFGTHISTDKTTNIKPKPQYFSCQSSSLTFKDSPASSLPSSSYSHFSHHSFDNGVRDHSSPPGVVGLQNLGNTCFMNSILQCLSNTQLITEFFISNLYRDQINYDNPLGHKGKVAQAYAKLIKDMWSGAYSKIIPRDFKFTIGEFQPQFAGYDQQDSQEFMGFLLDGLHEDLNRIHKKPHVSKIESNGRSDQVIASESWRRFLLRNDSALVETTYGQMKSHVTCKNCNHESVTFDEYSSLSLPIPVKTTRTIPVLFFPLPLGSKPFKFSMDVELFDTMGKIQDIFKRFLTENDILNEKDSEKMNPKINENNDSDFEMVNYTDEVVSDYHIVGLSTSSTNESQKSEPQTSKFYQFATSSISSSNEINKNYSSSIPESTSIVSFVGKYDNLLVYELEHDAPANKKSSQYTYSYKYNYKSPVDDAPEEKEKKESSKFISFDLSLSKKFSAAMSYSSSERIRSVGYIRRLTLPMNATGCDLYLIASKILRNNLKADSIEFFDQLSSPPFSLHLVTNYIGTSKYTIENSSDLLDFSEIGSDTIYIVIDPEFYEAHVNEAHLNETIKPHLKSDTNDGDSALDIYKCFDKFSEKEQLAETETIYCSHCKQHLPPIKKMDIWSAPDVLILHLKRFQYIPGHYFREKITQLVNFPIEGLDLRKYVIGPQYTESPPIYDLYAVSHHSGGLGGGHYTATCQNFQDKKWYYFNDSMVSSATPSSAISNTAYVLFYKRRTGTLKWGGVIPSETPIQDEEDNDQ